MKSILSNDKKFDKLIKWCLDEVLELEDYKLHIKYGVFLTTGIYYHHRKLIKISTFCRSEDEQIKTLFHELRHFFQMKTKMYSKYIKSFKGKSWYLEFVNDGMYVKGKKIMSSKRYEKLHKLYTNLPWEVDARKFADKTYKFYLKYNK